MNRAIFQKDISKKTMFIVIAVLFALKLILLIWQPLYLEPENSPIDDALMYNAAVSLSNGDWLGGYTWLAIAKNMFFAMWLSLLNSLHIPYLLAGNLLWGGASLFAAAAFSPVLKRNWQKVFLFTVLWFNPAATADFVSRVYRDNIFPALCTILFCGFIGFALRYKQPLKNSIGFLAVAAAAFPAAYLTREDGLWLFPFTIAAAVITAVFVIIEKELAKKALRCALLLVPFVTLAAGVLCYGLANESRYGRFVINEMNSKEFADACGAILRCNTSDERYIALQKDKREQLYGLSDSFGALEEYLESDFYYGRYGFLEKKEYRPDGLMWAMRDAADAAGFCDSAESSAAYWRAVADEINGACDSGLIECMGPSSGQQMPWRSAYLSPLLKETAKSLWSCASVRSTDARVGLTFASPELVSQWESYLGNRAVTIAKTNTAEPYYGPFRLVMYFLLDIIRAVYSVLLPLASLAALAWLLLSRAGRFALRDKDERLSLLLFLVMLGLLLNFIFRCAVVSYFTVTTMYGFSAYTMYLSSAHPLLMMFAAVGSVQLFELFSRKQAEK